MQSWRSSHPPPARCMQCCKGEACCSRANVGFGPGFQPSRGCAGSSPSMQLPLHLELSLVLRQGAEETVGLLSIEACGIDPVTVRILYWCSPSQATLNFFGWSWCSILFLHLPRFLPSLRLVPDGALRPLPPGTPVQPEDQPLCSPLPLPLILASFSETVRSLKTGPPLLPHPLLDKVRGNTHGKTGIRNGKGLSCDL